MELSVNDFTIQFVERVSQAISNIVEQRVYTLNKKIRSHIFNNIDSYEKLDEFKTLMTSLNMASVDFTYYTELKGKLFKNKELIHELKEDIDRQLRIIRNEFKLNEIDIYRWRLAADELQHLKDSILVNIMIDRLQLKDNWRNQQEFLVILEADLLNGVLNASIEEIKARYINIYYPTLEELEAKYK